MISIAIITILCFMGAGIVGTYACNAKEAGSQWATALALVSTLLMLLGMAHIVALTAIVG